MRYNKVVERVHVIFSGLVQGVGFRYTIFNIAENLEVVGWVKNLPDGCVEIVAEGEAIKLAKMIESLWQRYEGNIVASMVTWQEANGEFGSFEIKQ